jgi:hypothetical protein
MRRKPRLNVIEAGLGLVSMAASLVSVDAAAQETKWKLHSFKDRMTDEEVKVATLAASKPDSGIAASLVVRCAVEKLYLTVRTTARFAPGRMGLRYRVDNGVTQLRHMPVDSDLHGMSFWGEPSDLLDGKRLRLELLPGGDTRLFYEFDLTGSAKTFQAIPCKETGLR